MRTALALLTVVSCAPPSEPAQANAPGFDPLAKVRPHLPFRTMSVSMHRGTLRIDGENRYLTYDLVVGDIKGELKEQMRVSWDGQSASIVTSRGTHIPLPPAYAARVGAVLDEVQAGMPNLQFVEEPPSVQFPGWVNPLRHDWQGSWYRVQTPWTWDDGYSVYLRVTPSANIAEFTVMDHATGKAVEVYRNYDFERAAFPSDAIAWNIPLHPDVQSSTFPEKGWRVRRPDKSSSLDRYNDPPYHHAVRMVRFELDSGEAVGSLKRSCDDGPGTQTAKPMQAVWRVPQDADTLARLAAAQQACTKMRFTMGMAARVQAAGQGQRACYSGDWTIWNDATNPPTQLWTDPLSGCVQDGGLDIDYHNVDQNMPLTASLQDLRVTFDGQLSVQCNAASNDKWGYATMDLNTTNPPFDVRGVPTLTWNCWPGWDMTGVSFRAFPEYEAWANGQ